MVTDVMSHHGIIRVPNIELGACQHRNAVLKGEWSVLCGLATLEIRGC